MKTKLVLLLLAMMSIASLSSAQDSTTTPSLKLSAYIEAYYSNDLANPANHLRPGFFYSHNRHNEVALNLGFIKAAYTSERVRGNLALMTGTYAQYNLATEPGILQNIYEANAGIKLAKNQELWLDLGVLPSHIGFESAVGKDCWTLTRSLLADNTPYYEAGARLSLNSKDGQWYAAALLLNGWQRMTRVEGIQSSILGTQLTFKPHDKVSFNWSSYWGDEKLSEETVKRFFNNFYGVFNFGKLGLMAGVDVGVQGATNDENHTWFTPIAILRYVITDQWVIAGRAEYYADPDEVIISTVGDGFETLGLSLNLDYLPLPNVALRFEGRTLQGKNDYFFNRDGQRSSSNTFLTTALAISF